MTESQINAELFESLISLQEMDREIGDAQKKVEDFGPVLDELDAPLAQLEKELATAKATAERVQTDLRRLERAAEEKRDRLKKYEDRLMRVRDSREAAAANTELDLVRRALDADEGDALELMDQAKRVSLKIDELQEKVDAAREELEPRRQEILTARSDAQAELEALQQKRENHSVRIEGPARQMYEKVRGGKTRTALAGLTSDGACGHCYSMVPIQRQTEIRKGSSLVRCEACGVILYPGQQEEAAS